MPQLRLVNLLVLPLLLAGCASNSSAPPPPAPEIIKDIQAQQAPSLDPELLTLPPAPVLPDPATIKSDDDYAPGIKALVADDLLLRMNIQAIAQEEQIRQEQTPTE